MLKSVIRALDFSAYAEIALVLFVGCFVLASVALLLLSRETTARFAAIPLDDDVKDPRNV